RGGERSSVRSGRSPAEPRRFNTLRADDFDRYCEERPESDGPNEAPEQPDAVIEQDMPPEARPYLGELSTYVAWHNVPAHGWVWRPVYAPSWGPYVNGHWVWCPAGWTWVSDDIWGWAPYHYGRWELVTNLGWSWIPGATWGGAWVSF